MRKEYRPSFFFRDNMKNKLGFTVREHHAWIENKDYARGVKEYNQAQLSPDELTMLLTLPPEKGKLQTEIHLDFYSENKRTMFLLKYSEELAKDDKRY
jgi:hypothetical protein